MANETKIKRLAQFLFDNAEIIDIELRKSPRYRSIAITLDMFKSDGPRLQLWLSLYDKKASHNYLKDDEICIERFKTLCEHVNNKSGFNPLPEPVVVRNRLTKEDNNGKEENDKKIREPQSGQKTQNK